MAAKNHVTICLGSSCYARGNNVNLEKIRKYIHENQLEAKIDVKGELCTCICLKGPVILINGERFEKVDEMMLQELIAEKIT